MPASNRFTTSRSRNRCRGFVLLFAAVIPVSARADATAEEFSPQVWISPGIYSQHFDSSKHLRNDNWGLSAEVALARDHALIGGTYINSNRARTMAPTNGGPCTGRSPASTWAPASRSGPSTATRTTVMEDGSSRLCRSSRSKASASA